MREPDETKNDCLLGEDEIDQIICLSRIERIEYLEKKRNDFHMIRSRLKLLEKNSNPNEKFYFRYFNQYIEFLLEERLEAPSNPPTGLHEFIDKHLNSTLFKPIITFYYESA